MSLTVEPFSDSTINGSMQHYIAFLRGINLGKRRIKMETLRVLFEELRFSDVATFIASGNVIFSSRTSDASKLEAAIARHLAQSLGYAVDTFVRTRREVADIAAFPAFAPHEFANARNTIHVGFMSEHLSQIQQRALRACGTEVDAFSINERQFYWLCRIKSSDSEVWKSPAMKAVRLHSCSMRNLTTIRKLAALYPDPSS